MVSLRGPKYGGFVLSELSKILKLRIDRNFVPGSFTDISKSVYKHNSQTSDNTLLIKLYLEYRRTNGSCFGFFFFSFRFRFQDLYLIVSLTHSDFLALIYLTCYKICS